jgi:hypothetical protein
LEDKTNGCPQPLNYSGERNTKKIAQERFFSVELKSKVNLKSVTLTNGGQENVLIEGSIGELQRAEFADGVVLEVVGNEGVFRINLSRDDIKQKEQEKET